MNRRDFTKLTALGMASGASRLVASQAMVDDEDAKKRSVNDRINIGLIGAQNIGAKTHLPSLVGSQECQLVAICDVDGRILKDAVDKATALYDEYEDRSRKGEVKGYKDFREVLVREDIDAVLIATPDHWHTPITKAAMTMGKDVYVEKPLSLHVEEGRDLVNTLQSYPSIVQVGSQQRSGERFIIASEFVQNGLLGDIRHVDVSIKTRTGSAERWKPQSIPKELDYDMWLGPAPWTEYHPERLHYNFRYMPAISGGEIANWGAHFLDTAQMGLGADHTGPIAVRGMGQRNPVGAMHTSFFNLDVDFEYESGVTMKLKTGANGVTFYGSRGTLYVDRGELKTTPSELIREYNRELSIRMRKSQGGHLQNWFSCIRSRRTEDLHAPLEVGHRSATLCHLANISIELGRPLRWDPEREQFVDDASASAMLNRPIRKQWRM